MKKKGFTLVELLVAMLCTTLVFGMVFSTVYYISNVNGDLLDKSSAYYRLSSLDDQVKGKTETEVVRIITDEYSDIIPEDAYRIYTTENGVPVLEFTYSAKTYTLVLASS